MKDFETIKVNLFPSPQYVTLEDVVMKISVPNAKQTVHFYLFSHLRVFKVNIKKKKREEELILTERI